MLGPLDLLLSVKQSLSCAWVSDQTLGKNRHFNVIINVGQSHKTLWPPRITYIKSNIL